MLNYFFEIFSYDFMLRALLVGTLVSLTASLLGVSLVLKRYSMIGDGLSHVGFGALSIALALNLTPLYVSVPVCVIAAFFLLKLSENSKIKGDSAIALIASSSLAFGVIAASLSSGFSVDVYGYMFGSILAMQPSDVYVSTVLCAVVLAVFILCYHKIFAVTFDSDFAKATGMKTNAYNMLIALLTALTIVVGMRIMGAMLISSLIIFPALTAMRVFKSFRSVIICSAFVSVICFFFGLVISYIAAIPTGASVVAVNLFVFLLFSAAGSLRRIAA